MRAPTQGNPLTRNRHLCRDALCASDAVLIRENPWPISKRTVPRLFFLSALAAGNQRRTHTVRPYGCNPNGISRRVRTPGAPPFPVGGRPTPRIFRNHLILLLTTVVCLIAGLLSLPGKPSCTRRRPRRVRYPARLPSYGGCISPDQTSLRAGYHASKQHRSVRRPGRL